MINHHASAHITPMYTNCIGHYNIINIIYQYYMTFWHHVAHHVASFVVGWTGWTGWTGCTSFQTRNRSGPDASMYIGQLACT